MSTTANATHAWLRRVSDYHSGAGTPAERAAVEAHLTTCHECQEALAMYRRFYTLAASPLRLGMARPIAGDDATTPPFASASGGAPGSTRLITPTPMPPGPRTPRRPRGTIIGALAAVLVVALLTAGFVALFLPRLNRPVAQPTPTVAPTSSPQPTFTPQPSPTSQSLPPSDFAPVGEPVESNGTVFVTSYNGYLYALRSSDGHQLWRFHGKDGHAGSPPTVANGIVYFNSVDACPSTFSQPYLYAVNATTGALIWRVVGTAFPGKLIVTNDMIYAGSCEGDITAYRTSDGGQVWHKTFDRGCTDQLASDATDLYVNVGCVGMVAVRLTDGSVAWQQPVNTPGAPTLVNGILYVGDTALRASDGAIVHTFPVKGTVGTAAVTNDTVFIASTNTLSAWSATTGSQLWNVSTPYNQSIYGLENGLVYTSDEQNTLFNNGHLYAFRASNGTQVWSALINPVDTTIFPQPQSLSSLLYVGTLTGSVVALNASDGSTVWTTTLK